MEPAKSIIAKLGGEAAVAAICGRSYTAPYRWQYPISKGGTGGIIPQKHHVALLDHARANGVDLSADEFLPVHNDTRNDGAASEPVEARIDRTVEAA